MIKKRVICKSHKGTTAPSVFLTGSFASGDFGASDLNFPMDDQSRTLKNSDC